ncbi:MAG: SDR family oxidoreductase, partial [Bacillota bacterium]|nr:SDR family oxidoreductase [Bacillota bacterium]
IGGIAVKADVSKEKEAELVIDEALKCFGTLDVLVNNAAIAQQKLFTDITGEEWDRMFEVNVKGAFNCTKAALKYMIKEHRGKIINISSMWGVTGGSCEVHYSASKAAIIGMTKALAKEVGPSGIQVNCVAPGVIMTDMNSNLNEEAINEIKQETPLGVIGLPSDVAKTILFLASDGGDFITGQVISPNGGIVI